MELINLRFLFYGYTAAFLIIFGFILILVSRGRKIERELTRLKALAEEGRAHDGIAHDRDRA